MNNTGNESSVVATAVVAEPVSVSKPLTAPVTAGERIALIDVVRGFALFGIFIVNMGFMRMPMDAMSIDPPLYDGPWDLWANTAVIATFQGKFFVLFSFLFGYGMALQMRRAADRGAEAEFKSRYLSRCLWLLVFGVLHAVFLWAGDILLSYAILGMGLLLLRKWPSWLLGYLSALMLSLAIFVTGVIVILIAVVTFPGIENLVDDPGFRSGLDPHVREVETLTSLAHTIQLYANGTWSAVTGHRVMEWASFITPFTIITMWPMVLAMFLLGMVASRSGFFAEPERFRGVHRVMWAVGLLIGIPGNYVFSQFSYVEQNDALQLLAALFQPLTAPALTALYVVILITLWRFVWTQNRLAMLAPVGRMALTNYIGQSVIATFLFNSHGLGWMGGVGTMNSLGLVVLIFLCQILFSHAWLKVFRFGPLEWLWRCLTYGCWQPIWREPQPTAA